METIIKIELPLKRMRPTPKEHWKYLPFRFKWFGWLFSWGGGSVQEFGGRRVNHRRYLEIFRWHVLTIHRNEYHDRSDKEKADEYLRKWSECEKELQGLRLLMMGDSQCHEVKKLIRESLGVDLDEGQIL